MEKRSNVKSWKYVFYDFECAENTIDTETKRSVHEVNYCIATSICDKCPDNGSCDDCLPVHTFIGLGGQNALDKFCKLAFDHPVNQGVVFIAHNSSNYDAHFILITNGEYPEILANGGKLLEIKIKTSNSKLIDSCCFIAMPLSRFSDTFNIPHTKGTFPHMFNVSDNYNYVGPLPALQYYDSNGVKEPLRTQLIESYKAHQNDVFDFAMEIHEYCKTDVQLLKSGCIKFRNAFIIDTGIDPFQSCTIAGACMNVLRTSHALNQTPSDAFRSTVIAHLEIIQVNPWSGSRTAKKITGVSYHHAWSIGSEMYLKKTKIWAGAYYKCPRHEYGMVFMECHVHGCQTCFDLSTMNIHLNKSMGDLYRETMRWIARVINSGYMIPVMWECE